MQDTDAETREGLHQTAGGDTRDPWTPLADLRRTAGTLAGDAMASVGAGYDDGKKASAEMAEYLLPFIRERRDAAGADVISDLATAEVDGERLTDEEIVSYLRLLLPAGSETTYCSIGSLVFALLTNTDQLEEIK